MDVSNIIEGHGERLSNLEAQMSKLGNREGPGASFTKLAVKKFPEKATLEERLDAMRGFMRANFRRFQRRLPSAIAAIGNTAARID